MTRPPTIGELRHRLTLERPERTPDGAGGATVSWVTVADVWAAIAPASASETEIAGRLDGVVTHRVTLRRRADLAGGMRLKAGTRVLKILVAHDPDERGRWTECLAEEEHR
ncbi:phage head closure protein [Rhodobium gokarnense]|uniref:SPP1 family predicted phage head-tail adaptor n=1 Tax=Rhodobium gokarnense TaxID=364296 RepID=A0ABT3HC16_9HYPH|nr:phage head closure protein [Rhodobium gokarnense]MCW2307894.1 SPP1 family predicted phage head-tail adaptor [Rhodobium gokarnense]